MPLPTSSGLIGLFHPFAANVFADVGSGVSKLNPNQNNAAAEASGQAADDFSELFGASLDSLSGAKTSSIQTSGKLRTNGCVLSNQLKVDSLQTGWSIPSGIPPAAAVDDSDPAVSLAGDLIDADSVKAQMLAGYIESALQSIPATETKNAAKLAPPAETQKPADTQKEDASPAPPPQSDVGATVISIPLPLPVTLLLVAKPAAQTTDALSIAKPGALPATPGAPQVSVLPDTSKAAAGSETLAFQAHLLPEPGSPAHSLDAAAAVPQTSAFRLTSASAPAAALNPTPSQTAPQNTAPAPQINGGTLLFRNGSSAQGSTGTAAVNVPTVTATTASAAFSGTPQFGGKSPDEDRGRQSSSPAGDSPARIDNIVNLPGQGSDIKAPDQLNSARSSSSLQAMPMQKEDGPAALQPKTDITFRLQGQSGETVSVRVSDRAGDIQIAVRSTDPATAATLRHDLPTIQSGLERAGWRMESNAAGTQPAPAMHQLVRNDGGASDQSRQGAQSRAEDYSQGGRRRPSPNEQWMEAMNTDA